MNTGAVCHELRCFNGWALFDPPSGRYWGLVCSAELREDVERCLKGYATWSIETVVLPAGQFPCPGSVCQCLGPGRRCR